LIKPKFQQGERDRLPRRDKTGVIAKVIHQPETLAPALTFDDGASRGNWGLVNLTERYLYKIEGAGIPDRWFAEGLIEHITTHDNG
jgi:hypothetical protein